MQQFRYFKTKLGSAVSRFGTDAYVGCKRTKDGFVWAPGQVSRLPAAEMQTHSKSYVRTIKSGALIEVTEAEWTEWQATVEAASEQRAADLAASREAEVEENSDQSLDDPPEKGSEVPEAKLPSRGKKSKKSKGDKS